jgi:hypothetical protein
VRCNENRKSEKVDLVNASLDQVANEICNGDSNDAGDLKSGSNVAELKI